MVTCTKTAVRPLPNTHMPSEAIGLMLQFVPELTLGVVTTACTDEMGGAILMVCFFGKKVRDGTLLNGESMLKDIPLVWVNNGHFQNLTLDGGLDVFDCQSTQSRQIGHEGEDVSVDCYIRWTGTLIKGRLVCFLS